MLPLEAFLVLQFLYNFFLQRLIYILFTHHTHGEKRLIMHTVPTITCNLELLHLWKKRCTRYSRNLINWIKNQAEIQIKMPKWSSFTLLSLNCDMLLCYRFGHTISCRAITPCPLDWSCSRHGFILLKTSCLYKWQANPAYKIELHKHWPASRITLPHMNFFTCNRIHVSMIMVSRNTPHS